MKKYNYKYLIGFMLGIILFGGIVYASINYSANVFLYDNSTSTLNSNNVQGAIHELAQKYSTLSGCPSDKICLQKKSTLALGDYVAYTPSKTSYTIDNAYTGYTNTRIINPSELNLWRVIKINGNNTVEIISEYTSSTVIVFSGKTGYKNLVGYLNVLASQYETSGITVGSRYFGYSNQTEYITSDTYFTSSAPWTCNTGGTCSPDPDDYEAYGGGDTGYLSDFNLVNTVLGTRVANMVGTETATSYWIASRNYKYVSTTDYKWSGLYCTGNNVGYSSIVYKGTGGSIVENSSGNNLRPIVILGSGHTYSGVGTKDYPMEIIS